MVQALTIFGKFGLFALSTAQLLLENFHMSTVVLIDRKTGTIIQTVITNQVELVIDSLMRNRDPRNFVATEAVCG